MSTLQNKCNINVSDENTAWNVRVDSNTHTGLTILGKYFDMSKKLVIRELVSEKLKELHLENPIKEVATR